MTGLAGPRRPCCSNSALGGRSRALGSTPATGSVVSRRRDRFDPARRHLAAVRGAPTTLGPARDAHTKSCSRRTAPSSTAGPGDRAADPPCAPPERTIVLVGGGDLDAGRRATAAPTGPGYPARRTSPTWARRARRWGARRRRSGLGYDTLFARVRRPARQWPGTYRGDFVGPVTALAVDSGGRDPPAGARVAGPGARRRRCSPPHCASRPASGSPSPPRPKAPDPAATLATVSSAPIGDLVEHMLTDSDNDVAEAMAAGRDRRRAAGARSPTALWPSATGWPCSASPWPASPPTTAAGCPGTTVSRRGVLRAAARAAPPPADHPELRPLLPALPVAGVVRHPRRPLRRRHGRAAPAGWSARRPAP